MGIKSQKTMECITITFEDGEILKCSELTKDEVLEDALKRKTGDISWSISGSLPVIIKA